MRSANSAISRKSIAVGLTLTWFAVHVAVVQHNVASGQVTGIVAENAPVSPVQPGVQTNPPTSTATVINSRRFSIPFTVDASGTEAAKIQLLVARPAGALSWQLQEEADPTAEQFHFHAPADGVYYFTTRTIDVLGRPHSTGNVLEVRIDTTGPEIRLEAEADDSGRIDVRYEILDASAVKEVHLQYMTDRDRVWTPLETRPASLRGELAFTAPGAWQQASVHVTVVDAAGNQQQSQQMIARPRIAVLAEHRFAAATVPGAPSTQPVPYRTATTAPEPFAPPPTEASQDSSTGLGLTAPAQSLPQGINPGALAPHAASEAPSPEVASPAVVPWNALPTAPPAQAGPRPRTPTEAMRPLDNSPMRRAPAVPSGTTATPAPPATVSTLPAAGMPAEVIKLDGSVEEIPLPAGVEKDPAALPYAAERATPNPVTLDPRTPRRFSNSPRFSLEYELEAIGSGGVEEVELWGTTDGGQTWKRWGADPDRQSPFDIETQGAGTYAFRIVVLSRSGLASPRPLSGDPADLAITVDPIGPEVKITGAQYGEGDRVGSLVIRYACNDAHLVPRPIALAFSESLEGPWTTIASGLRNEGVYVWPADPQLPRQFYLRIDATDEAGNVGSYILDQPIDAQGLAPRARIRGFQSITGGAASNPGEQTATRPSSALK